MSTMIRDTVLVYLIPYLVFAPWFVSARPAVHVEDAGSNFGSDATIISAGLVSALLLAAGIVLLVLCAKSSVVHTGVVQGNPPPWTRALSIDTRFTGYGFEQVSPGMSIASPNCVMRHRLGRFDTDGARWAMPMTSGKHVFSVLWPVKQRGIHATVGVVGADDPIHAKGSLALVGSTSTSWGVDISTRRSVHANRQTDKYPRVPGKIELTTVPGKFYVFVDMDSGQLSLGSDAMYWGAAHVDLKKDRPLYLAVGCVMPKASITVMYLGSENKNLAPQPLVAGNLYIIAVDPNATTVQIQQGQVQPLDPVASQNIQPIAPAKP